MAKDKDENVLDRFFMEGKPKKDKPTPKKSNAKEAKELAEDLGKVAKALPDIVAMQEKVRDGIMGPGGEQMVDDLTSDVTGPGFVISASLLYDILRLLKIDPMEVAESEGNKSTAAIALVYAYMREYHQQVSKKGKK